MLDVYNRRVQKYLKYENHDPLLEALVKKLCNRKMDDYGKFDIRMDRMENIIL